MVLKDVHIISGLFLVQTLTNNEVNVYVLNSLCSIHSDVSCFRILN